MRTPGEGLTKAVWRAAVCAAVLLWAVAWARAGDVRVEPTQSCSRQPRITVLRDGKPAPGITVELIRAGQEDPIAILRTDAKGEVVLPKLPRAEITVAASWNSGSMTIPDLWAGLFIQYRPDGPAAKKHFTMALTPNPDPGDTASAGLLAARAARATETKPTAEVQQFSGMVANVPGGTGIPDVAIAVARLHSAETRPVLELHTDARGHFSVELPPGDYVVAFVRRGWRDTMQAVTISSAAKQSEMQVLLRPVDSER